MNSLASIFNNLKVGTKIGLGSAVVILALMFVGVTGYLGISHVSEDFEGYAEQVTVKDDVSDIDRRFLNYRRLAGEIATHDDAELAKMAHEAEASVKEAIERTSKQVKAPEEKAKIEELAKQFQEYAELVHKSEKLHVEKTNIVKETLDASDDKLIADFEDLIASGASAGNSDTVMLGNEALKQLLLANKNVDRMLGIADTTARDAADKAFANMKAVLAQLDKVITSPAARKDYEELAKLAETYHSGYERAAEIDHDLDEALSKEMPKIAAEIAGDTKVVVEEVTAEETKLEADAMSLIGSTEQMMLWSAIGGTIFGAVMAWLIGRGISTPIRAIADVLLALANGNTTVDVPYAERGDEVGENARAAQIFKENLLRIEKMEADQKEIETRTAAQRKADMRRLADEFQKAVGGIVDAVSAASSQLEGAAASLTGTAASTQEPRVWWPRLRNRPRSTSRAWRPHPSSYPRRSPRSVARCRRASSIAGSAVEQAAKTNDRVTELSQSADRIGDVIGLINTIAGQTNLLALNATIEAARAGDAGKGFAVVAQEVKALAAQTAKATNDIATQIASMQSATREAVGAIREITETINKISEISGAIAAAVEEQGATTQEISRNVTEAAKGTAEVASSITEVSRGASETGSASSQVLSSAKSLSSESQHSQSGGGQVPGHGARRLTGKRQAGDRQIACSILSQREAALDFSWVMTPSSTLSMATRPSATTMA